MKITSLNRWVLALAAIAAPASAAVVSFDNTAGVFPWRGHVNGCSPPCQPGQYLSLIRSPEDQDSAPVSEQHIFCEVEGRPTSQDPSVAFVGAAPIAGAALGPAQFYYSPQVGFGSQTPLLAMSEGWTVGPDLNFGDHAYTEFNYSVQGVDVIELPLHYYAGVRFMIGAETHYAWVELQRVNAIQPLPKPLRWAYETTPDTPITIPGVGTPPPPLSPVIFPNPGFAFMWAPRDEQFPGSSPGQWLNTFYAALSQPNPGPTWAVRYSHDAQPNPVLPRADSINGNAIVIAVSPPQKFSNSGGSTSITVRPPLPLIEGQTVGPALDYVSRADMFLRWSSEHIFLHLAPDHFYVGARMTLSDGFHYGWIELVPRIDPIQPWLPTRWSFHPLPNVPIVLPAFGPPQPFPPFCPDLNADHVIGAADLGILLGSWGTPGIADFNGDGTTNSADLALILASWGPCP